MSAMLHRVATLLGVALVIAGCAIWEPKPPSGFVNGTSLHHIKVGGRDRSYRLYMPAGLPASVPLVVMMHGVSGSARQAERDYKWDEVADSGKFVVAYPDGLNRSWNVDGKPAAAGPDEKASMTSASSARPSPTSSTTSASTPPRFMPPA